MVMMSNKPITEESFIRPDRELVKMVGRIESVRTEVNVDGTGTRSTRYFVSGQDWGSVLNNTIYIDPDFFNELSRRFQAPGDFAALYVIAHEVGHHVQNLEGTLDQAQRAQQSVGQTEGNRIQVGVELQADCYAGVWAANARDAQGNILEPGDIEEGMRAAEAIGDDMLQKQSQGVVVPESFTHGSSAQRQQALHTGLKTGDPASCKFNR